jgi:hypothetical protein
MARLYADEGFPLPVVEELRRLGHDVQTVQEAGRANQGIDDARVLADAVADLRAVLTHYHADPYLIMPLRPTLWCEHFLSFLPFSQA